MKPIPSNSLWNDVLPRDPAWQQFIWQVALTTTPFILIAIFALIFDWMTRFPVEIGVTTYEVGGGVLGVFLALRTNSGYERWWEARKLWGGITNQSRSLATAGLAYGPSLQWKTELIQWIILFAHATRHHLRGDQEFPELLGLCPADAVEPLMRERHRPLFISLKIAELLQTAAGGSGLPAAVLMQMERDRNSLIECLGGCERIFSTPVPRAYTIVIRQFLVLFLATFPFGILQKATWLTPMITAAIAFPMLALDEIGAELQNPFSKENVHQLPLDLFCQNLEGCLRDFLEPK